MPISRYQDIFMTYEFKTEFEFATMFSEVTKPPNPMSLMLVSQGAPSSPDI